MDLQSWLTPSIQNSVVISVGTAYLSSCAAAYTTPSLSTRAPKFRRWTFTPRLKRPSKDAKTRGLNDGQITHLISVRLKIVLHAGCNGFPVFPPLSFLHSSNYICIWTFFVQSPQGVSKNISKRHMTLKLVGPNYRSRRNYYSINSQELHGCNAAHYSLVINSSELQDWNCNCNCNPN